MNLKRGADYHNGLAGRLTSIYVGDQLLIRTRPLQIDSDQDFVN